jgi:hypothetical protein
MIRNEMHALSSCKCGATVGGRLVIGARAARAAALRPVPG